MRGDNARPDTCARLGTAMSGASCWRWATRVGHHPLPSGRGSHPWWRPAFSLPAPVRPGYERACAVKPGFEWRVEAKSVVFGGHDTGLPDPVPTKRHDYGPVDLEAGAEGGSRTHTGFSPAVFETAASAIPPLRPEGSSIRAETSTVAGSPLAVAGAPYVNL